MALLLTLLPQQYTVDTVIKQWWNDGSSKLLNIITGQHGIDRILYALRLVSESRDHCSENMCTTTAKPWSSTIACSSSLMRIIKLCSQFIIVNKRGPSVIFALLDSKTKFLYYSCFKLIAIDIFRTGGGGHIWLVASFQLLEYQLWWGKAVFDTLGKWECAHRAGGPTPFKGWVPVLRWVGGG